MCTFVSGILDGEQQEIVGEAQVLEPPGCKIPLAAASAVEVGMAAFAQGANVSVRQAFQHIVRERDHVVWGDSDVAMIGSDDEGGIKIRHLVPEAAEPGIDPLHNGRTLRVLEGSAA